LEAAVAGLEAAGVRVLRRSSWWRSAAWPDPAGPPYLNGVAIVETSLGPADLLARLHRIERDFGRDRAGVNAPRTLDLDLIAYARLISTQPALPHPRAHDRLFVMGPVAEIAPRWKHPTSGVCADELAAAATVGRDALPHHGAPNHAQDGHHGLSDIV